MSRPRPQPRLFLEPLEGRSLPSATSPLDALDQTPAADPADTALTAAPSPVVSTADAPTAVIPADAAGPTVDPNAGLTAPSDTAVDTIPSPDPVPADSAPADSTPTQSAPATPADSVPVVLDPGHAILPEITVDVTAVPQVPPTDVTAVVPSPSLTEVVQVPSTPEGTPSSTDQAATHTDSVGTSPPVLIPPTVSIPVVPSLAPPGQIVPSTPPETSSPGGPGGAAQPTLPVGSVAAPGLLPASVEPIAPGNVPTAGLIATSVEPIAPGNAPTAGPTVGLTGGESRILDVGIPILVGAGVVTPVLAPPTAEQGPRAAGEEAAPRREGRQENAAVLSQDGPQAEGARLAAGATERDDGRNPYVVTPSGERISLAGGEREGGAERPQHAEFTPLRDSELGGIGALVTGRTQTGPDASDLPAPTQIAPPYAPRQNPTPSEHHRDEEDNRAPTPAGLQGAALSPSVLREVFRHGDPLTADALTGPVAFLTGVESAATVGEWALGQNTAADPPVDRTLGESVRSQSLAVAMVGFLFSARLLSDPRSKTWRAALAQTSEGQRRSSVAV